MKIYIDTIPKAGTYFTAAFLSELGFTDTGLHVGQEEVLRTADFDARINAERPTKTAEKRAYAEVIRGLKEGELAFGHYPVALHPLRFPGVFFVCCYRHPRKTLVSEFIDFRFRRKDIGWISPRRIADDQEAFRAYMERHAARHLSAMRALLGVSWLMRVRAPGFTRRRYAFCNFDDLLTDSAVARNLAAAVGADPERAPAALEAAKAAETKTKATDIAVNRAALWTPEAERLYAASGAERLVRRARRLGWTI